MNKLIIAIVAVVAIAGGFYMVQMQKSTTVPKTTESVPPATQTTQESAATPTTPTPTESANVVELTVNGDNFKFAPNTLSVKKGQTVKLTFNNTGGFHDLKIDEFNIATHQIKDGASETIEFVADKTGSFAYYCSVGKHRAMGMVGTLTVTE